MNELILMVHTYLLFAYLIMMNTQAQSGKSDLGISAENNKNILFFNKKVMFLRKDNL